MELPSAVRSSVASPLRARARAFLESRIARAPARGAILRISLPAPAAPLESFLAAVPRDRSLVWRPRSGTAVAGAGAAYQVDMPASGRFRALRAHLDRLAGALEEAAFPGIQPVPARLFGGLAFAPGVNDAPPWTEFGDGCFTLPRWCYAREERVASLCLSLSGDADAGPGWRAAALDEYDRIAGALAAGAASELTGSIALPPPIPRDAVTQLDLDRWRALVEAIKEAIGAGRFEKIVAARRAHVRSPRPLKDIDILARLAREYGGCTCFAFRREGATFLGASPERLFSKRGLALRTQALAGTALDDPDGAGIGRSLLESEKDLGEHRIVVRDIAERLRAFAPRVTVDEAPRVRPVRDLLHLHTRIACDLQPEVHAVDVLARLHPTPAVGGSPARGAVAWITQNEPVARGWYAGPVGWIGTDGDAELVVAIRSGVVCDAEAFLYAGAGVVRDSTVEAEYDETALKQEPLLRALGVDGRGDR